jgi:hypothetical protein
MRCLHPQTHRTLKDVLFEDGVKLGLELFGDAVIDHRKASTKQPFQPGHLKIPFMTWKIMGGDSLEH